MSEQLYLVAPGELAKVGGLRSSDRDVICTRAVWAGRLVVTTNAAATKLTHAFNAIVIATCWFPHPSSFENTICTSSYSSSAS